MLKRIRDLNLSKAFYGLWGCFIFTDSSYLTLSEACWENVFFGSSQFPSSCIDFSGLTYVMVIHYNRYYRLAMQIVPPDPSLWHRGCVMTAQKGDGRAWMQPMIFNGTTFNEFHAPREVCVSSVVDPADATFCEPVEKANSSHSFTAGLANTLGLR
jgi:hypothetical protein